MDDDAELLALLNDDAPRRTFSSPVAASSGGPLTPPPQSQRHNPIVPLSPPPVLVDLNMSLSSAPAMVSSGHGEHASSDSSAVAFVATRRRDDDDSGDGEYSRPRKAARQDVVTEKLTSIQISQGSSWLDQLPALLAQYRFVPLPRLGTTNAARAGGTVEPSSCTIGAVVSKSDAKVSQGKSGANAFGMLRVWSMRGMSGGGHGEEVAVLVCDAAFREQYRRLDVGSVIVLCKLELMKPSSSTSSSTSQQQQQSLTLRCAEIEQLRPLGFAKTLKPCSAVNKSNGEQCKRMVNVVECAYCSFHVSELNKVLRSNSSSSSTPSSAMRSAQQQHAPSTTTTTMLMAPTGPFGGGLRPLQPHVTTTTGTLQPRTVLGGPSHNPLVVTSTRPASSTTTSIAASPRVAGAGATITPVAVKSAGVARTAPSLVASAAATLLNRPHSGLTSRTVAAASLLSASQPQRLQAESFIATRGHEVVSGSSSRTGITSEEDGVAGGTYAGVVRLAGTMEVTGVDRSVLRPTSGTPFGPQAMDGKPRASLATLGVTSRGRNVLSAAVQRTDDDARAQAVQDAMKLRLASVASSPRSTVLAGTTVTSATSVPRAQQHYAPLAGTSRLEEDMVLPAAHNPNRIFAKRSSVVGALAASMRAASSTTQPSPASTGPPSVSGMTKALSSAGAAAQDVQSRHDDLRKVAEKEKLDASSKRLLEVDKALSALDKVFEQKVNAVHCRTCRRYFPSRPHSCATEGHALLAVQTVKRFYSCDHCKHRVTVLGEELNASLLYPSCPKCRSIGIWNAASAAPTNYHVRDVDGDDEDCRRGVQQGSARDDNE